MGILGRRKILFPLGFQGAQAKNLSNPFSRSLGWAIFLKKGPEG